MSGVETVVPTLAIFSLVAHRNVGYVAFPYFAGPEGLPSEEYTQPRVTVDGPEKENCSSTRNATTKTKEQRKKLTAEGE